MNCITSSSEICWTPIKQVCTAITRVAVCCLQFIARLISKVFCAIQNFFLNKIFKPKRKPQQPQSAERVHTAIDPSDVRFDKECIKETFDQLYKLVPKKLQDFEQEFKNYREKFLEKSIFINPRDLLDLKILLISNEACIPEVKQLLLKFETQTY